MLTSSMRIGNIFLDYLDFESIAWDRVWDATLETLYMSSISVIVVFFLGILLGLLLFETRNSTSLFAVILYKVVALSLIHI